jgi:hypothetical protein
MWCCVVEVWLSVLVDSSTGGDDVLVEVAMVLVEKVVLVEMVTPVQVMGVVLVVEVMDGGAGGRDENVMVVLVEMDVVLVIEVMGRVKTVLVEMGALARMATLVGMEAGGDGSVGVGGCGDVWKSVARGDGGMVGGVVMMMVLWRSGDGQAMILVVVVSVMWYL